MPKKGKGGSLTSPKGIYSTRNNPIPNAKMTKFGEGPMLASPRNSDQTKVRSLRQKAYNEVDSLRGANGI